MYALDRQYARYTPGTRLSAAAVRRARYVDDLRVVVAELSGLYDAQVAELSRRAAVAGQAYAALEMRMRALEW
jgi:hypothetical protein